MPNQARRQKHGGLLANLGFNIIIPTLILTKLSGEDALGPAWAIVVALSFPVGYGVRDYLQTREPNFFSLLGIISVILTGGMSLLELPPRYIAIKEAAIPGIIGIATLVSVYTRYPLVRLFLLNEQVLHVDKVYEALEQHGNQQRFQTQMKRATVMVAASFFLSSALNFILAETLLVSEPGTPAFAEELGRMTALSFPVIALPSMIVLMAALWYLLRGIQRLTHLKLEDLFVDHS